MNSVSKILVVSTSITTMGGISALLQEYEYAGYRERWTSIKIDTHTDGTKFLKLAMFFKSLLLYGYYLIADRKIEIVHLHVSSRASFWRKSVFIMLGKLVFSKKIISHIHSGEFLKFYNDECSVVTKVIVRYVMGLSSVLIVLSESWKNDFQEVFEGQQIKVLYNSVRMHRASPKLKFSKKLLFMGRYGEGKGIYDLVRTLSRIEAEWYLECHGDGEREYVSALVNDLGVGDRVLVGSWVSGEQKNRIFSESDIYVLPSYHEGMPMGILEAMSWGMPVISTHVGGIGEMISDGKEGFLINPGDGEALKNRIEALLGSENLFRTMSENALRKIDTTFEVQKSLDMLGDIYDSLTR